MRRYRAIAQTQPDRRFLFWVLTGLAAATISSGIIALATAMTMAGIP
jgi:hypothetical protein